MKANATPANKSAGTTKQDKFDVPSRSILGTKKGEKYHRPHYCGDVPMCRPQGDPEQTVFFETEAEAQRDGKKACDSCFEVMDE